MPRVSSGPATHRRRKKVLKRASGFRQARSKCYRMAKVAVMKAQTYEYRDRKVRKREFRSLWNIRISAAAKQLGLSYSRLIGGLKKAKVALDRKMLADLAVHDMPTFQEIVKLVQGSLKQA